MKKLVSLISALLLVSAVFAQTPTGGITASVISRTGRLPIAGAAVTVFSQGEKVASVKTSAEGVFAVGALSNGNYSLEISADGFTSTTINVKVEHGLVRDLVFVTLSPALQANNDVDDSVFAEFDLQDSGYSDAPTILFANDVYNSTVGYGWSPIRYKNRGYDSQTESILLNGVALNDAITGYSPYSLWSGLNEATRSKETSTGIEAGAGALGGFNGVTDIDATPTAIRKGWRFSALTNSALYRLRLMASYASGSLDNGWSYAFNVSARVGGNDWVKGVFYRSLAYYAGVQKSWDGGAHILSLYTMGAPGERGAQNASTQEVYDLMGDNMYNSNWGYQNGKVRNSRVRRTFEPVTVLKYRYNPNERLDASATLLWRTGKNGYTALDWYDASDPRPDYYRNLPSYFNMEDEDYDRNSEALAEWAAEAWNPKISRYSRYQHLDWDRLYNVNYNNPDGRSKYALEERHVDQNDLHAALNVKYAPSDIVVLNGGLHGRLNSTENYKLMNDLLGGQYYLNVDSFAERDFASAEARLQNDLDYYIAHGSAEKIRKGGKYGYDYMAQVRNVKLWGNSVFTVGALRASIGASVGYDAFWRDGLVRKGLFAGTEEEVAGLNQQLRQAGLAPTLIYNGQTSKGRSAVSRFLEYSVKGSVQYVLRGGHRFYANVGWFSDAPTFASAFISPRTRNTLIDGLKNRNTFSADVNYQFSHNGFEGRVTGYFTKMMNMTDVMSFYDDTQNSFTNFAMTGINQRHMGIELGVKVPLPVQNLSLTGVFAWGEHIYTGTPHMKQTMDNSAEVIRDADVKYWSQHPIFKKGIDEGVVVYEQDLDGNYVVDHYQKHYVPSSPQLAAQLGLKYNVNYWFFELNGQMFAKSYLDMNPLYRTEYACAGPDGKASPVEVEYMAAQEDLYGGKAKFLLNASVGKSWYIQRKYNLGFSLSVNNILNDRNFRTGGYEQTRLATSSGKDRYLRFDSKYFYMQGINYMLNVYFRF